MRKTASDLKRPDMFGHRVEKGAETHRYDSGRNELKDAIASNMFWPNSASHTNASANASANASTNVSASSTEVRGSPTALTGDLRRTSTDLAPTNSESLGVTVLRFTGQNSDSVNQRDLSQTLPLPREHPRYSNAHNTITQ